MIILSKLADYGVIVATHFAAHPDRQATAAAIAAATRLPPATVAKLLKALAHAGLVTATRGARAAVIGVVTARDRSAALDVARRLRAADRTACAVGRIFWSHKHIFLFLFVFNGLAMAWASGGRSRDYREIRRAAAVRAILSVRYANRPYYYHPWWRVDLTCS